MEGIRSAVYDVVVEALGMEKNSLSDDLNFVEDLGCDSLDFTDLAYRVGHRFDMDIPDSDFDQFKTIGDAVNYVAQKKGVIGEIARTA